MRHKDKKAEFNQREFDYEREDRRNLINHIQIPSFNYVNSRGRTVFVCQTSTMKDLLKVIEDHCGINPDNGWHFFLSELATEMSVDERTACRAIADCVGARLLSVRRSFYKHNRSHYQINWVAISEIIRGNPETAQWDPATPQSAEKSTHDKPNLTHDKLSSTHDKLSFTHDKLSFEQWINTTYSRGRGLTKDVTKKCYQTRRNFAGWPFKIELQHLKYADAIQRLWVAAKSRSDVTLIDDDRERFFSLAKYVARIAKAGQVENPGGFFSSLIVRPGQPKWIAEPCDIEAARKAMAQLDCDARAGQDS